MYEEMTEEQRVKQRVKFLREEAVRAMESKDKAREQFLLKEHREEAEKLDRILEGKGKKNFKKD